MSDKSIQKAILERISEEDKVTFIEGMKPSNLWESPNFDVFDFTPNKAIDGKNRFKISGPPPFIMLQASLLKAIHDILGDRLGFGNDFKKWFEAFEYEFQFFPGAKNMPMPKDLKPWGQAVENRPKYKEISDKEFVEKNGYRLIKFWPDRKAEKNFKVFAGSYSQIQEQILLEMKLRNINVDVYGIPCTSYQEEVKFHPQVLLYFVEDLEDVEDGYSPVDGRISFRLMKESSEDITEAKAKTIAQSIKTAFAGSGGYVWQKGKTRVNYQDTEAGVNLILNCRNVGVGVEIIQKILALTAKQFDDGKVTVREYKNPAKAAPIVPTAKKIYGENHKQPRKMPIADVKFRRAELHIWGRPRPVVLLDLAGTSKEPLLKAE